MFKTLAEIAIVLSLITLGQRLTGYENKPLGYLLIGLGIFAAIYWIWDLFGRTQQEGETRNTGLRRKALTGCAAVVLVALVAYPWIHDRWYPPIFDPNPRLEQQAQIAVSEIKVIPKPENGKDPVINVYFENIGKLSTVGLRKAFRVKVSRKRVEKDELIALQDSMESSSYLPVDDGMEIEPGGKKFFTLPPEVKGYSELIPQLLAFVLAKQLYVYILVSFRYRDHSMNANVVATTETCSAFFGDFVPHDCGRQRTRLREIK